MNSDNVNIELNFAENIFHILLADDDVDDRELFKDALAELSFKYKLSIVTDGEELMKELQNSRSLPDILFLDINMPKKNGIECLLEIKKDKVFNDIPVIILSTSFNAHTINELYRSGAQHAIAKPIEFDRLKKLISFAIHFAQTDKFHQALKKDFLLFGEPTQ